MRGSNIGILGLAFKPNTDDMREAASVDIIRWITNQGSTVRVYDPVATETGREALAYVVYTWNPLFSVKIPTK